MVACYWSLRLVQQTATFLAIPDACVDLVFDLNNKENFFLIGPHNRFKKIRLRQPCEYFGIRFLPGAIPSLMKIELAALKNKTIRLLPDETPKVFELASLIASEKHDTGRVKCTEQWLQRQSRRTTVNTTGLNAINHILAKHGILTLDDEFASAFKMSLRQIRRHINRLTGFSIKEFSRIIRFQHALSMLGSGNHLHDDIDYFDQSHLIREFKQFTGTTPGRFAMPLITIKTVKGSSKDALDKTMKQIHALVAENLGYEPSHVWVMCEEVEGDHFVTAGRTWTELRPMLERQ